MAGGQTTTGSTANSLNVMVAKARQIREQRGVMPQLVDKATLAEGTGLSWREVAFQRLSDATTISEGYKFENDQQITDALISGTPVEIGISVVITNRVKQRIDSKAYAQMGSLAGNAIQRKKAKDGITQLDAFSTSLGGGGTLSIGYIDAATAIIEGNATEPGTPPFYTVVHRFQIRDFVADLAPSGTYPLPAGISAEVITTGRVGPTIGGTQVFHDSVTAPVSNVFKGGVFSKEAIVLVQGYSLKREMLDGDDMKRKRASGFLLFDEYIYLERADSMGVEMNFDATQPTS